MTESHGLFEGRFTDGQPVPTVRNVYCIGRNYADHAAELNNPIPDDPVLFLKSTASLRAPSSGALAHGDESFHHEAELVLLVGRHVPMGRDVSWEVVDGLALGLDLTRREVQTRLKGKGLPWTIAKSFAGAAVVTDFLRPQAFADLDAVTFSFSINGEARQAGDTRQMLFKVPRILSFLASMQDLHPGDLVYTGTPAGVGPMRRGDRFVLRFDQVGAEFAGVL